jgi:outer membrane receptor protein involved in Fe transport
MALSAFLTLNNAAAAQTAASSESATSKTEVSALPEVVVTAQRRDQSIQSVGIAITAIDGKDLALRGINTVNGLQYQTIGLEITPQFGSGQAGYRLRGVGFDDYASNNSSPVGFYIDEVAYPIQSQTTGQVFDMSQVEVLRGPQGTLWGRNTTGGAISFTSNKPTNKMSEGIDIEEGNYDYTRVEAFVSGPLTDTLKFRIAGITEQGGAFQKNPETGQMLGNLDRSSLRGQLEWTPNSKLDVLLEVSYGHDHSDGQGVYRFNSIPGPYSPPTPAATSMYNTGWGASPEFASAIGIQTNTKPFHYVESSGVDLHVSYDLDTVKVTNIFAIHSLDRHEYEDWDGTTVGDAEVYFHTTAQVLSDELRFASEGSGPLKWVGGFYFDKEDMHDVFDSDTYDSLGINLTTPYSQHAETEALFGQFDYRITNRLTVTGGLRVEHEERDLDNFSSIEIGGPVLATLAHEAYQYTNLSGKAEADYHLSSSEMLYASISKGVKSGGYTAYNTTNIGQLAPFKYETLWAYETGIKTEYFHRTLQFNADGFYYRYIDEQIQGAVYDQTQGVPIGKIVNVPSSHIFGIETELKWKPVHQLEIDEGVSYKQGTFDNYQGLDTTKSEAAGVAVYDNYDGHDLGFPRWSVTGSATWTQPVLNDYLLVAETDYAFRGKESPVLLGPTFDVDSYWLANATLTFSKIGSPWSVGLWGRNITNTHYDVTRNYFLPNIDIAVPGAPATFGGRVTYKY